MKIKLIIFLLFMYSKSFSQIIEYKTFSNHLIGNKLLNCQLLFTNDFLQLFLKNIAQDTIFIPNKLWLETNTKPQFLIYCLSDSLLRVQTTSFNFLDSIFYSYSNNYSNNVDIFSNEINFQKIKLSDSNQYGVGGTYILPGQILKVDLPFYFHNKYVFVRLQTFFLYHRKQFWIQFDSNSVYCVKKEFENIMPRKD
ncbi:MAG: hypothetical protein MJ211_16240 [Bacteroidales bacterium]|nr:hypothetical protein [Bacteroidales bacterium]